MSFRLKKDDLVIVVAGKDKGKTGKILRVLPKENRAIVEKVNIVKRHQKPSQKSPQGGIVEKEASIHLSNLMFYHEKEGKGVRLGAKLDGDTKVRIARKAGKELTL